MLRVCGKNNDHATRGTRAETPNNLHSKAQDNNITNSTITKFAVLSNTERQKIKTTTATTDREGSEWVVTLHITNTHTHTYARARAYAQ